jgi:YbbR domain-containing protein
MKFSPFVERLGKKISENWIAKIGCVVLALFLYLFYQAVSLERKSFVLPLVVRNTGIMTSADNVQRSVRVTIRGKAQDISLISERDFEAYIDFSRYAKEGAHEVPVQLKIADNLLAVDPLEVRFFPDSIPVNLEPLMSEYVPVNAVLYGEARYGFALTEYTAVPSMVRISGPQSMVLAVNEVSTEGVSIDGKDSSFSASVKLNDNNSLIKLDTAATVDVYVVITPKEVFRTFSVPITTTNLHEGLNAQLSQNTLEMYVSGSQLDLERVSAADFSATVDCAHIFTMGAYALPVVPHYPPHVYIESSTPKEITVVIEVDAKDEDDEP